MTWLPLWFLGCGGDAEPTELVDTSVAPCTLEPCVASLATASFPDVHRVVAEGETIVVSRPGSFEGPAARVIALDVTLGVVARWERGTDELGSDLDLADVDGDGFLDLALADTQIEQADGAHLVFGPLVGGGDIRAVAALTIDDVDSDDGDFLLGGQTLLADFGAGMEWAIGVVGPDGSEVWVYDPTLRGVVGAEAASRRLTDLGPQWPSALEAWDGECNGTPGPVVATNDAATWFAGPWTTDLSAADATASWETADGMLDGAVLRPTGDLDGDGCVDLVVGATQYDGIAYQAGLVFVVPGANPVSGTAIDFVHMASEVEQAWFGRSIATGDINGDGADDLLVSSREVNQGAVRVFLGPVSDGLVPDDHDAIVYGENAYDLFGRELAVFDGDGDQRADVLATSHAVDLVPGSAWSVR